MFGNTYMRSTLRPREKTLTHRRSSLIFDIWPKQPSVFLLSVFPLLFKNSAEKEKTIFQNILAVISRLPCLCTADSGTGPSPDLSILLHTSRTPLAQS
ncbi:hypothetical protein JOB18_032501 [Solea senegalensis]|uniref:Uncharacterized protein n=1 Tax=Solea senegalensis TaxID=28829 RepID=A0AAV6R678_SOLSE|nr:hypothetical protein JOB18_032501 [Solea senegalensis]